MLTVPFHFCIPPKRLVRGCLDRTSQSGLQTHFELAYKVKVFFLVLLLVKLKIPEEMWASCTVPSGSVSWDPLGSGF